MGADIRNIPRHSYRRHMAFLAYATFSLAGVTTSSNAQEDPAASCISTPTPECLLEQSQDALDSASSASLTDPVYIALAQHYVEHQNPQLALLSARSIKDPIARGEQLLAIARLNAASGEATQANTLFAESYKHLTDVSATKECTRQMPALHNLLLSEAILQNAIGPFPQRAVSPLLQDAVVGSLVAEYSKKQKLGLAYEALATIRDQGQKDFAYLPYAETQLLNIPSEQVVADAQAAIRTPALLEEFMTIRLPRALASKGDPEKAVEWAGKIPDPQKQAAALLQVAEMLIDQKNPPAAAPLLTAARTPTANVADTYQRSALFKMLGKLHMRSGNLEASHMAFAEAINTATTIEYLPRRLSAVISILENQREVKDFTGLHTSAFTVIRGGLLEAIDAYGKPEETNRFLNVLDEQLTPNDTIEILSHVTELKTPLLRQRILHKLSVLQPAEDPTSEIDRVLFRKVQRRTEKAGGDFEIVQRLILLLNAAEQLKDEALVKELQRDVDMMLRQPLQLDLPAAVIVTRRAQGWRFYARMLLANGHKQEALDAFRRSINAPVQDDPQADLFLSAMMDENLIVEAIQFYPIPRVGLAAAQKDPSSLPVLLDYLKASEKEPEQKEQIYFELFQEFSKAEQWNGAYEAMLLLQQADQEKWFWQDKWLEEPSDETRRAMALAYMGHSDHPAAVSEANKIKEAELRAKTMLELAEAMPENTWHQQRKALEALPFLPGPTLETLCK